MPESRPRGERDEVAEFGDTAFTNSPSKLGKFVIEFTEKWAKVIRAAKLPTGVADPQRMKRCQTYVRRPVSGDHQPFKIRDPAYMKIDRTDDLNRWTNLMFNVIVAIIILPTTALGWVAIALAAREAWKRHKQAGRA